MTPARPSGPGRRRTLAAALAAFCAHPAQAFIIDVSDPDLKLRWDNTLQYSTGVRLKDPSGRLIDQGGAALNQDDGDRAFKKGGLISSRLDLLSEAEVAYGDFGARLSGAAWYDAIYQHHNDNGSPATSNQSSAPYNEFTPAARRLHGRKAEFLDAFVHGQHDLGGHLLSWRAGKHTLQWGETMFLGANGVAGLMAPVDAIKAASVPNTQFKDLMMPVGQVSGQWQLAANLALGAYYQYEWKPMRLPAGGTYFASLDATPGGADRLFLGSTVPYGGEVKAKSSGQGGLQVRWRPRDLGVDLGFYALRQHDRAPQLTIGMGPTGPQRFLFTYAEGIRVYGASANTNVGDYNVAGELSVRLNNALVSQASILVPGLGLVTGPARGDSWHLNLNTTFQPLPNAFAAESSLMAEVAFNRTYRVTAFASNLDPNVSRDGMTLRGSFTPTYRQVWVGWDVDVPLSLGFTPRGRGSAGGGLGPDHGGDMTLGIKASWRDLWHLALSLTHYYGPENTTLNPMNTLTFGQSLKDRDFVAFSVRRAF